MDFVALLISLMIWYRQRLLGVKHTLTEEGKACEIPGKFKEGTFGQGCINSLVAYPIPNPISKRITKNGEEGILEFFMCFIFVRLFSTRKTTAARQPLPIISQSGKSSFYIFEIYLFFSAAGSYLRYASSILTNRFLASL